ncbi:FG-GAP-like repeat-containing protein [Fluviicola sp.]|uniref:FG-GAP-like repeat-containing protein n=1 Tax=Fluviicola sp. TaxID=1917219 RepID=UPI0031DCFF8B
MKKLLIFLSFSMIALANWSQVSNACFSSRNDISIRKTFSQSRGMVKGDFDSDGVLDIVSSNYVASASTVKRFSFQKGLGNGKFGSSVGYGNAGLQTQDIRSADFNNDGKLDVAYINLTGIYIFHGQGNGLFDSITTLTLTNGKYMAVGDFNEDGAVDIVGTSATNQFTLFAGTLGNPTLFSSTVFTITGSIQNMEVADMDGDNHLDVVSYTANGVYVSKNNNGSLGNFFTGTNVSTSGSGQTDLTICDIDNDGDKDVVTTNKSSNNISVLKNNGTGTLNLHATYATELAPDGIDNFDINQDGFKDIVVANVSSSTISIFFGGSGGVLSLYQTIQAPGSPKAVVVGHFTSDTYPDIVSAQTSGAYFNSFVGNATNNYLQTNLFDIGASPSSAFAADFNGDGNQDVAITQAGANNAQIYLGNGAGGFTAGAILTTGTTPFYITGADLDNSGSMDLVVVNNGSGNITVFYGTGSGTFSAGSTYSVGTTPVQAKIGHLNGDAFTDIVVTNSGSANFSVLTANGASSFNSAVNYATNPTPYPIVITDYDNDGFNDVVVGHNASASSQLLKFKGDGSGTLAANGNIGTTTATYPLATSLESGDLDGDGDKDIIVGRSGDVGKIFNPAVTTGSAATNTTTIINTTPGSGSVVGIKIIDVNNDGKLDVMATYNNGGGVVTGSLVASVATGFGTNAAYVLNPPTVGFASETDASGMAVADFNNDGRVDAIIPNKGSNSFTLHLNTTPVITAGGPTTFCSGNSVTLTSTTASQWYDWDPNNETTPSISATATGPYYVVTSSSWSDWCQAKSDTITVTVTPGPTAPTITAGGPTTFCSGGNVVLTSSQATGNQWYKNGVLISGATAQNYTATTAGTYTVTYTSGGCTSPQSTGISVTATQTPVITAGGPTTFCTGGSVVLTSNVTSNILWSNGATTPSITVTTSGNYSVQNIVSGCPTLTSNTITVTVAASLSTPTISPAGPVTLCPSGSVTLTSSSATNNIWSTGATTQSITVNTAGSYFVHLDNGSCTSANSTAVTVTNGSAPATPTITAGGPTTFCTGGSVTLTSSTGTSYLWSNGATTQSITVTTSGSYTVQVTNSAGCQSASSVATVVTVNTAPATPAITAGGPTTFCAGGSVTLTSSAGTSYLWSTGATTASINVTTAGSYTVQVTNASGCQSAASSATTVTVNSAPAAPTITASGPTTFCAGGSVTLTSSAGTSYLWSTGATTASINVTTAGSYTVQVTNSSGCQSGSSTATVVTVNAAPAAPTITASGPTTFCAGGSVTLTSSAGNSYLWSTGATTASINVTTAGSYTVQVTNAAGCQSTASAATVVTVNAAPAAPTITAGGSTTFCAGGSVTLTSSAGTSYLWSTGATTPSINVTTAGSYTVQVTNSSGCQSASSAATTVTVNALPAAPTITAGGPTTFCNGNSVTLTSSAGNSYLWSTGATTASINVTTSGNYTVQVTNAAGCQSPASAATTVTVSPGPTAPTITAGSATTFCAGGSVTLTSSAGTSYLWSTGATTPSINVTTSGSYTVQITNASGCQSTASAATVVTVNPAPATPTVTAGGSTTFCAGGSVTLTSSAGTSYLWSTGATTQSITVTTAGSYSVQVTNAAGCLSAASTATVVTVNALPAAPTISAGGPTTFCAGGSVTLTSSAGTSYLWSTGATTSSINVTTAGSYTVQVTNAAGCQSPASSATTVTVNSAPAAPTITAGGPTTFCSGGSVTLTSSAGNSYLWSTGATTPSITVTTAGSYTVQVMNTAGCQSTSSAATTVTVNASPSAPTITASGSTSICAGNSVTLTSSAGTSYLWSTGATTASINVTTAGSYTVQVTNAAGCQSPASSATTVTVNALPATPTITAGGPTTFCSGGSVTLTSSSGSAYLWSTGATTASINVTTSGNYTVQVTNGAGCQSAASAATTVTVNPLPATPTITASGSTTFCAGGSVTLTASAGTSYLWSTGATTASINVTTSGTYSVQVTNAAGCQSASSAATTVTVNSLPTAPTITASGSTTFCAGGSVTLTSSTGTSYLWSTGETTQSINVTASGSYTVQVSNGAGCQSLASAATTVTVNPLPATPTITASSSTTFCAGGSVTLTSSAGNAYLWSTGATTASINVTTSGTYSVQVINTAGCQSASSAATVVTVNALPAAPTITAGGPTTFCAGGSVTLTSSTGNAYLWSTGATTASINVTTSGSYTVQVSDANGCQSPASAATVITVNPKPATPTITASGSTTFCLGQTVTLTSSTGNSYLWSTGETTQSIVVGASGSYTVQVANSFGCLSDPSAPKNVTVNVTVSTPSITASGPTTFCEGGSVTLSTGFGLYYFLWSNGETTQSIDVDTSGTFTVVRTNILTGCQSLPSSPVTVTVNPTPAAPSITASGATTFCAGGSVTLTSGPGAAYLWSTGATTASINVTTSGSYTVQITDANGCQSPFSTATAVTVHPNPTAPTITASGPTTFCDGGSVTLTSSTATSYLWSTGETTQSIIVTTTGSYSVAVTNGFGCSTSAATPTNVTVNPNPAVPTITAGGPTTFCDGDSVILTSSSTTGNLWSTGETTQSITVTASGTYSLEVSNGFGCSTAAAAATSVTVNPIPAVPTITAGGPLTFCDGGSVTLTSSASTGNLWSTGETTPSITVTTTGSYTVEQIQSGCSSGASASTDVIVNPNPAVPTITAGGPTTFCDGDSVILTSSSTTGNLWSTGETTQSITVTASGNYSLEVSNGFGCSTASASATNVTVNPIPAVPTITAGGPTTFCSAGGSVVLTSSASTGNLWSTGETTQSITVTTTGSYTVEQILAGCSSGSSASTDVLVNPTPATPTITAGSTTTFCTGDSVVLTSTAGTSYLWSTGETTQSITVTTSGSYSVTIIDGPCASSASNVINVTVNPIPAVPTITAGGPTTFCSAGGSVVLTSSASTGNLWSTGETTQSITVATTGSYTVEQILSGCSSGSSASTDVLVNPTPATPTITAGGATTFCTGDSVVLTSTAGTSYLWSTGETTQSITVTTSGSYSVTIIDGPCSSSASNVINVTVNPIPTAPTITAGGPTTFCSGGSVVLTSSASTGNLWSTGETTQSITVATAGSYTVTQTLLGCTSPVSASTDVFVNPTPAAATITAGSATTFCAGGSVVLTSTPGTSYLWSTGETTQSITVTTSGSYSVTIIDGPCSSSASNVINVTVNPIPAAPTITASGPTTFCAGGSVVLTSSASTGNMWSTGATTPSITVSASGTYTVNQTVLGCTSPNATQIITVNPIPAAPTVTAGGPTTFCTGGSVVLTSSASSGNTWSTTETTPSITVTSSGSYTVTQTVLGCTSAASAPVNVIVNTIPAVPTITASGPTTFCAGGSVTLTSSSATNNFWSNGATTQSITVSSSGTFLVQVISNGCSSGTSAPKTVTVNSLPPAPTIVTGTTESICSGSSVTLTSSSTGGNLWSTGATTQSIVVSTAGSYYVTVTDGNGCTSPASPSTVVTVNPLPTAPVISTSGPTSFCSGGSVALTSSYGSGNLWSSGSTANSITVSSSGTYTVTHTDGNGCVSPASSPVTVTVNPIPAAPVITASGPTSFCSGGSVTLTSSQPTGNSWSTAALTPSITVTTSGVYSVIYIDGNGCASPSSAPVVVNVFSNPSTPSITAGGATTICQGSFVTLTSSYTSGNTWSTGGTTQSINATTSGNYTVTHTNANGCSSTSAPTSITVIPVSSIPTISASGSTTICDGSSVTLTSSDVNSTWSTGATTQAIVVTTSGSYSVVGNQTGCPSQPSAPVVVTVNPAPAAPVITPSGSTTICEGEELFLFTSGTGTNTWSTGYVGQVLQVTASGNYWVSVQNAYGCTSSSTVVPVVINTNPAVSINPFADVCTFTAPFTMSNGLPSGGIYTGQGITTNIFYPAAAGEGSSIVTYTYTDANDCSASAQTTITVNNCLGIDEKEQAYFSLFPNPNNGQFQVVSNGTPMDHIIIYDAQGKMVYNEAYPGIFTIEFDLNAYSNGVYYIEINSDQEIRERIPLIINH